MTMSDGIRYTAGEQARRASLVARGCARIVRGRSTGRVDTALERLEQEAADRTRRDTDALYRRLDAAKDAVADAKATERTARGDDRRAARAALREAQQAEARVKQAARRYGL